jgi:tetratricopeptide (TPR) repeat protein
MLRRLAILLGCLAVVVSVRGADLSSLEELRFVRELRERGDADLALEYLQRLSKSALPPDLARELPLEEARTRLKAAGEEPDSTKRLAMYTQAEADFEKYVAANKGTPTGDAVAVDLADASVLRGRTMLSRAMLHDTPEKRDAEGAKAREVLVRAGEKVKGAAAILDKQIAAITGNTPADVALRARLSNERLRMELNIGLNIFDQAQTYDKRAFKKEVLQMRGSVIEKARAVLEKLAAVNNNNPICWQAMAWAAFCWNETGEPKKARERFTEILGVDPRIAADGQRLARYFRLLVIKESPEPGEKAADIIIEAGRRWIADYPRYLKTPEGYGLRYLLAEVLLEQARTSMEKLAMQAEARGYLQAIESTENDFSDRAKRLKIVLIGETGGFTRPVADLKTFDDCFVRAQYEIMQMGEDEKKLKGDELQKQTDKRIGDVLTALDHALKTPDGKKPSLEVNTARTLYSFWAMRAKRYADSIRVGEEFARNDPRSAQAAMAAMYALQSHALLMGQHQEEGASKDTLKEDREKMLALAHYMEERWPRELAGDVARFQIGVSLLREKELNYPEILNRLESVTPTFHAYPRAQWEVAQAGFQAEKERAAPIPGDMLGYHKRALAALARIPEPAAGGEPENALLWFMARLRLTRELFATKNYAAIQASAEDILKRLPALRVSADDKRNEANHNQITYEAQELLLYARASQADAAEKAGNAAKDATEKTKQYTAAAALLDPLVKDFSENKVAPMRKNLQLGMAVLAIDLKTNLLLGKLDQAHVALNALQSLSSEGGAQAGSTAILNQLAALIQQQVEDLKKKHNTADLEKAAKGFTALLDDIVKKEKPSPKFAALLARCYSNMDNHKKAAELLGAVAAPPEGSPDTGLYRGIQLLLVRELRMSKDVKKAEEILDGIIGTEQKKGWGFRDINALKERVLLLEEKGEFAAAAQLANTLLRQLHPKIATDNALKEHYLECYYHVTLCMCKHAATLEDMKKKEKQIRDAAQQIIDLESRGDNFGTDASRKRFEELLAADAALKAMYDQLKGTPK